jgi:hypothetical protein
MPDPASQPGRPVRLISGAVRLAIIAMILLCGWKLLETYRDLFGRPNQALHTASRSTEVQRIEIAAILPGAWSFGDVAWGVRLRQLSQSELQQRWQSLGDGSPPGKRSELEGRLLALLQSAGKEQQKGPFRVIEGEMRGCRLRGVIEGQGSSSRLRLAQLAWEDADGWSLVEAIPVSGGGKDSATGHLLPLQKAPSLGRRLNDDGRLAAELLGPVPDFADQCQNLREAGWSVEVRRPGEQGWVVCKKGSEAVGVWRVPGAAEGAGDHLLVVALAGSNTKEEGP